jgi:selenocysteine-specific elongation factor
VRLGEGADAVWLTQEGWATVSARLAAALAEFHRQFPLRRGIPRGELRSRLQPVAGGQELPVRQFNALVERGRAAGLVEADDAAVWRQGFAVTLTLEQRVAADHVLAAYAAAPYAPPSASDTLRLLGGDEALLEMMVEQKTLVRLGGGVLLRAADFDAMVARIRAAIQERGAITLAETRDLFDTSRKYAQAVLEELDARRITRREGDARVLR